MVYPIYFGWVDSSILVNSSLVSISFLMSLILGTTIVWDTHRLFRFSYFLLFLIDSNTSKVREKAFCCNGYVILPIRNTRIPRRNRSRQHSSTYQPNSPFQQQDRKSTRLNSSHPSISYAVFCLK